MCPQRTNPEPRHLPRHRKRNPNLMTATRTPSSHSHQHTIWEYITTAMRNHIPTHEIEPRRDSAESNTNSQTQVNLLQTPPTTPTDTTLTTPTQESLQTNNNTYQHTLMVDKRNEPWGDIWAVPISAQTFRIVSKNTGTINPLNLDMQAITHELRHLNVSIFAGQEPNIHWDPFTNYQIYQQCKSKALQIKLTTASSQEPAADWFKPGGTMLLTLDPWTSRIVSHGSDSILGRWTYQEFFGKNEKRVIVVSGYHVCNQQFDAAANTATAQQTRLLQARGIINPKPCKLFLTDLIEEINIW